MSSGRGKLSAVVMGNLKASPVKSTILIVGCVVLVVLIVRQVGGGPAEAAADATVASDLAAADGADEKSPMVVLAPRVPRPRIGKTLVRDPFAMDWLVIEEKANGEHGEDVDVEGDVLALQLTLTGEDESGQATAVVSGTVVHIGDQLADYVIERIEKRSVVLRKGQEIIKLRMP